MPISYARPVSEIVHYTFINSMVENIYNVLSLQELVYCDIYFRC